MAKIGDNKNMTHLIRVVVAGDIPESQISVIAANFAEKNGISDYTLEFEVDDSLIGGFVIYTLGSRYDYSVKGQLERIGEFVKRTRDVDNEEESLDFDKDKIRESIKDAIDQFPEEAAVSIDSVEIEGLNEDQLRSRVQKAFDSVDNIEEVGIVRSVSDGVATVSGLDHCMVSELVSFTCGAYGIALNLERNFVGVILLSGAENVVEGMICKRTRTTVSVPVGYGLLGRVVDPLGRPIDGKGIIRYNETRPIESPAPSIVHRSPVNKPLHTGITAIDALTPIGRGQRELIIGDRQTGKTAIAIDTILNQKGKDTICVYVAIGQKMSTIVSTVNLLEKYGALDYTIIVAASSSDSASLQYIAPFSGCAMAEKFMFDEHKDVLIVYDDLSKHAQAYRAISLLLRRPPGREAYPGDVFYLHSRLLERAAKLSEEKGGGSITALPIIETLGNDISAYIPTNVISITDGQIYLAPELFFSGQRPAINVGLSVSRVGGAAQTKATKKVGGPLRISLAQAREMASFAQFGSDLDANTQLQLKRGIVLNEVLKQEQFSPWAMEEQVVILYMATSDKMNFLAKEDIREYFTSFVDRMWVSHPDFMEKIQSTGKFEKEDAELLDTYIDDYKETYLAEHTEYRGED
ncbi:MAG: F0F1 ATP synthase subunit alpha [Saccharofermentans sp.]|nr:F0F1 ATP synthase subunit alpha [Saccharofermentans sp.]